MLVYGEGSPIKQFYMRDGIHLNNSGTKMFLYNISKCVSIIRKTDHRNSSTEYIKNDRAETVGDIVPGMGSMVIMVKIGSTDKMCLADTTRTL